jgi:hypothetical protein
MQGSGLFIRMKGANNQINQMTPQARISDSLA